MRQDRSKEAQVVRYAFGHFNGSRLYARELKRSRGLGREEIEFNFSTVRLLIKILEQQFDCAFGLPLSVQLFRAAARAQELVSIGQEDAAAVFRRCW